MDRTAITAIIASVFITFYTGCSLVLHYDPVTLLKFPIVFPLCRRTFNRCLNLCCSITGIIMLW